MKKYILLLVFCICQIQASAWQISIGLNSENLVSWNLWENNEGNLKQALYLYNKSDRLISLDIYVFRIDESEQIPKSVYENKALLHITVMPGQVKRFGYPTRLSSLDYLEFQENGSDIGILKYSEEKPPQSILFETIHFSGSFLHK